MYESRLSLPTYRSDYLALPLQDLKDHRSNHSQEEIVQSRKKSRPQDKFYCAVCGEFFYDSEEFKLHKSQHLERDCEICGVTVATQNDDDFKEHIKVRIRLSEMTRRVLLI